MASTGIARGFQDLVVISSWRTDLGSPALGLEARACLQWGAGEGMRSPRDAPCPSRLPAPPPFVASFL